MWHAPSPRPSPTRGEGAEHIVKTRLPRRKRRALNHLCSITAHAAAKNPAGQRIVSYCQRHGLVDMTAAPERVGQGPVTRCVGGDSANALTSRYGRTRGRSVRRRNGGGGDERSDQARCRQLQSSPRRGDRGAAARPAREGRGPPLRRHGDLCRDPGERPRRRRLRDPVDLLSGERPPDGALDHHRRAAPRFGAPHHGGGAVFRLRPPGPQTRTAHADLRQARRQHHHSRRRRPRADARPARRTDPRLLRHPDRQSLRRAR